MKSISTCLWFDHQAEEAVRFYSTVFEKTKTGRTARYGKSGAQVSGQKEGSVMTVDLQLENLNVCLLNGGPLFKFNPSFSLFVSCSTAEEIETKWEKISQGGQVRMGLDKYPWADKYGWTTDRFGVEWQLMLTPNPNKVTPTLLFVDQMFGKGEEAIKFYMSVFPNSKIHSMSRDDGTNTVAHCSFSLNNQPLVLMEGQGKHGHTFNEAGSMIVNCETQEEIDFYWSRLSQGGSEGPCGWLKDPYGVSWQINPADMDELMSNPQTEEKVMSELLKMKKIDLAVLRRAAGLS